MLQSKPQPTCYEVIDIKELFHISPVVATPVLPADCKYIWKRHYQRITVVRYRPFCLTKALISHDFEYI